MDMYIYIYIYTQGSVYTFVQLVGLPFWFDIARRLLIFVKYLSGMFNEIRRSLHKLWSIKYTVTMCRCPINTALHK